MYIYTDIYLHTHFCVCIYIYRYIFYIQYIYIYTVHKIGIHLYVAVCPQKMAKQLERKSHHFVISRSSRISFAQSRERLEEGCAWMPSFAFFHKQSPTRWAPSRSL